VDIIKISTRKRNGTGKSYTRKIRQSGWVPAIYYGHNQEPVTCEVDSNDLWTIVRKKQTTHLFNLNLDENGGDSIAVIKELQRHVIKDSVFYHVDFQHVNMNEAITVECPIEIVGISIGVKDDGGILGHSVQKLRIECLPANIPEKITVDVSNLRVGDSIHVRDLAVENVQIKNSPDEVIATVSAPSQEVTPAATEAAASPEAKPAQASEKKGQGEGKK
jgi:large subunit ribosomal protein L25